MSSTTTTTGPGTVELQLRYGDGVITRLVSTAPPRECTLSEIPLIDLTHIDGDLASRTRIADQIRDASSKLGFFYIKNHGIKQQVIDKAREQAVRFFRQTFELKEPASTMRSKFGNNGWRAAKTSLVNPKEGLDVKESFGWSYSPEFDPLYKNQLLTPEIEARNTDEPHLWSATSHLEGFKSDTLAYWQECLGLARKLNKIFALSLSLSEEYFDSLSTFPGSDGVFNFYPALTPEQRSKAIPDVGLGSHTDFQCFTLLWQDMSGGLQVLNQDSEWVWATPIEGTFIVNVGDFLSRLTNDRYRSTIHRAYNRGIDHQDRISMPFFFGFNYDAVCEVLPSCMDNEHPAKYEPISCGKWRELRFSIPTLEAVKAIN